MEVIWTGMQDETPPLLCRLLLARGIMCMWDIVALVTTFDA